MSANVVSLAARRARAEGWEDLPHGQVDWTVFECGEGMVEIRLVTGSAAEDTLQVSAVRVCESTLDALYAKIQAARAQLRARKAAPQGRTEAPNTNGD